MRTAVNFKLDSTGKSRKEGTADPARLHSPNSDWCSLQPKRGIKDALKHNAV